MSKALAPHQVTQKQIESLTDFINEQLPLTFDGLSAMIMIPVFGDISSLFFNAAQSVNVQEDIIKVFKDSWDVSFDKRGDDTVVIIMDVKQGD